MQARGRTSLNGPVRASRTSSLCNSRCDFLLIAIHRREFILDAHQVSQHGYNTLSNLEHNVSRENIHTFFWDHAEEIALRNGIPLYNLILGMSFTREAITFAHNLLASGRALVLRQGAGRRPRSMGRLWLYLMPGQRSLSIRARLLEPRMNL